MCVKLVTRKKSDIIWRKLFNYTSICKRVYQTAILRCLITIFTKDRCIYPSIVDAIDIFQFHFLRDMSSAFHFFSNTLIQIYIYIYIYTGCPRRKGPNFGRVFLRSNYTDIIQNTYIQSSMVTEILAREVWNFNSYYSLIDYQIHIETGRNMWFL